MLRFEDIEPTFFSSPSDFRAWLEANHDSAMELWVGFWKTGTKKTSITWPESVDEALCFGWIDAIRKSLGRESYMIRFMPRKISSVWSAINLRRVEELIQQGRMTQAGLKVYEERKPNKRHGYTYGGPDYELGEPERQRIQANHRAWKFFQSQTPSYQRVAIRWVMSAKRPETREQRLTTLIEDSERERRLEVTTKYKSNP